MKTMILGLALVVSFNAWSADVPKEQVLNIEVNENGFQPKSLDVKPNVPIVLKITRKTDSTCATEVQIPLIKIRKNLPLNETVTIKVGPLKKGDIKFGCGMNMMDAAMIHVK